MPYHLYNAEGARVAKGSLTVFTCDLTQNGFLLMRESVLGQSGEQLAELARDERGAMAWSHTNVYAAGALFASYDPAGLHFLVADWLGSRRAQTDYAGNLEQSCQSLPFGNGASCSPAPSSQLFTTYQRDTESGNDYAQARYYASSQGRFLSPDPSELTSASLTNPQSFNLYSYAMNNPLINTDPTGMECVWDDGSYDSADDPDTGSADKCKAQGGSWVDHSYFQTTGMGDWSQDANSNLTCGGITPPSGPINYAASAQSNSQMGVWGWYQAFKGGGTQDFKGNSAFGSPTNQQAAGNFNFGASVAAKGWSLKTGQFLAGAGAVISSAKSQLNAYMQQVAAAPINAQMTDPSQFLQPPPIPPSTTGPGFPGFPVQASNGIMTQGDQNAPSENQSVVNGYLWQSLGCTQ